MNLDHSSQTCPLGVILVYYHMPLTNHTSALGGLWASNRQPLTNHQVAVVRTRKTQHGEHVLSNMKIHVKYWGEGEYIDALLGTGKRLVSRPGCIPPSWMKTWTKHGGIQNVLSRRNRHLVWCILVGVEQVGNRHQQRYTKTHNYIRNIVFFGLWYCLCTSLGCLFGIKYLDMFIFLTYIFNEDFSTTFLCTEFNVEVSCSLLRSSCEQTAGWHINISDTTFLLFPYRESSAIHWACD